MRPIALAAGAGLAVLSLLAPSTVSSPLIDVAHTKVEMAGGQVRGRDDMVVHVARLDSLFTDDMKERLVERETHLILNLHLEEDGRVLDVNGGKIPLVYSPETDAVAHHSGPGPVIKVETIKMAAHSADLTTDLATFNELANALPRGLIRAELLVATESAAPGAPDFEVGVFLKLQEVEGRAVELEHQSVRPLFKLRVHLPPPTPEEDVLEKQVGEEEPEEGIFKALPVEHDGAQNAPPPPPPPHRRPHHSGRPERPGRLAELKAIFDNLVHGGRPHPPAPFPFDRPPPPHHHHHHPSRPAVEFLPADSAAIAHAGAPGVVIPCSLKGKGPGPFRHGSVHFHHPMHGAGKGRHPHPHHRGGGCLRGKLRRLGAQWARLPVHGKFIICSLLSSIVLALGALAFSLIRRAKLRRQQRRAEKEAVRRKADDGHADEKAPLVDEKAHVEESPLPEYKP